MLLGWTISPNKSAKELSLGKDKDEWTNYDTLIKYAHKKQNIQYCHHWKQDIANLTTFRIFISFK